MQRSKKSIKCYVQSKKPKLIKEVINEALHILDKLGVPFHGLSSRRLELMAMAFLAVVDVSKPEEWSKAKCWDGTRTLKSRDIIQYINKHFKEEISPGSYDDIRRKHLILPVTAGIIMKSADNPNAARNDGTRGYALDPEYVEVVRTFGSEGWEAKVCEFTAERTTLAERLGAQRDVKLVPITLPDGARLAFSPGGHNQLQKAVIESFLPRYGFGARVLYLGDAADKFLVHDEVGLKRIGAFELSHGELPDIVAYSETKNWLYLIEAVHSFGPMSPIRVDALRSLLSNCDASPIFVTAFQDRATFRKFAPEIAWETEVWIAEAPDHLIHFDGEKFLGPYQTSESSRKGA